MITPMTYLQHRWTQGSQ